MSASLAGEGLAIGTPPAVLRAAAATAATHAVEIGTACDTAVRHTPRHPRDSGHQPPTPAAPRAAGAEP
jgi:hypothetical protein